MKNYIEYNGRMIVSDGKLIIVQISELQKQLVLEENRLETLKEVIANKERIYTSTKLLMDNSFFYKNLVTIFLVIMLAFFGLSADSIIVNQRILAIIDLLLVALTTASIVSTVKTMRVLDRLTKKFNKEMHILLELRKESYEKVRTLNKKIENGMEFIKDNEKEELLNFKRELESLKEEKPEHQKVKTLGTK